ncbi:MAG: hypothetical protein HYZ75_06955 [Elusimicrobia bacterium]|nr:hypothetical protein [Elusimicrobiota bacterium]
MVAGRVEAESLGAGLTERGLWLSDVPLDTLGGAAVELGRVPGAAGASCASAGGQRDALREASLRALADAFAPRWVSAAPPKGTEAGAFLDRLGRPNLLVQASGPSARALASAGRSAHFPLLHSPARFSEVFDGWLDGLAERAGRGEPLENVAAVLEVRADRIDRTLDAILLQRMDGAQTDFIRAAYRVILGRVGRAVAAVCRRRLATEANGARLNGLLKKRAPLPVLLVIAEPGRLADCGAPKTAFGVPYAAALALPARPEGKALDDGYDDAKRLLDKLANYQLDLDRIAAELEAAP